MKVTGFGKIKEATIAMAPFVMLVGKNNTGKSYLASLLWAILNADEVFPRNIEGRKLPSWYDSLMKQSLAEKGLYSHAPEKAVLQRYLNETLAAHKEAILSHLFSFPGMNADKIELTLGSDCRPANLEVESRESDSDAAFRLFWSPEKDTVAFRFRHSLGGRFPESFHHRILWIYLSTLLNGSSPGRLRSVASYIPAARTGLILAFRPLVSGLLDILGFSGPSPDAKHSLPLPTIRFLQNLTNTPFRSREKWNERIVSQLETQVLRGHVAASEEEVPDFSYRPLGLKESLPLHVTSSMVTELAPFLLLLRNMGRHDAIIFEEPEAHLHLSAQRQMARALAKLANSGTTIVVTTHSDTFVQQVNNLMQMYANPGRDDLLRRQGYSQDELLNPSMARAYEFIEEDGMTITREVERSDFGFVVPSLNETLEALVSETLAVQDRSEDGAGKE